MVQKCCPTCFGIGSYFERTWSRDQTGVSIYKKISVRNHCEVCNGTGRLAVTKNLHAQFCNTQSSSLPVKALTKPLEIDQVLGYLIFFSLLGYAALIFFQENSQTTSWSKIALTLEASIVLLFVLHYFSKATRFLRWSTLVFFLTSLCAAYTFEFI